VTPHWECTKIIYGENDACPIFETKGIMLETLKEERMLVLTKGIMLETVREELMLVLSLELKE